MPDLKIIFSFIKFLLLVAGGRTGGQKGVSKKPI